MLSLFGSNLTGDWKIPSSREFSLGVDWLIAAKTRRGSRQVQLLILDHDEGHRATEC